MSLLHLRIQLLLLLCFSASAYAYEDAKVMPAKIRRVTYRFVTTDIAQKTDGSFSPVPLSKPLSKALTFNDILKGERDSVRHALTAGFLRSEGFNASDAVGAFAADVKSRVQVSAPILALGLSSTSTVAVAVPIYMMQTAAELSFQANDMGELFIGRLASDYNNQISSARDAVNKLNDAVFRLNTKLVDNGYRNLESWSGSGLGDSQIIFKNRAYESGGFALAMQGIVTLPTGRIDDPDNLLDKGFGDGQWDVAIGTATEQSMSSILDGFSLSQYFRFTEQLPGQKTLRLVTLSETIEVPKQTVKFDLGEKIETGAAALLSTSSGWGGVLGYNFSRKGADRYFVSDESRSVLERDTLEMQHQAEAELMYSGVPAFRRGTIPFPFELKVAYKHQLASRNMPVTHMLQIDTGIFF